MKLTEGKKFNMFTYWGLKIALSFAFLSAVADRFGLWGAAGTDGVVWGNFESFIAYTKILAPWSPSFLTSFLAWIVTIVEIVFGFLLLTRFRTQEVSFLSGILLCTFGVSMILTVGFKPSLDYSVFTAAFGALFLSSKHANV